MAIIVRSIRIIILDSKRKRYVYCQQLNYKHRQTIEFIHDGLKFSLLLIDPNDSRAELTLLHMPIETNNVVIDHIFKSLNPKWVTSDIKHAPGDQKRGDRWELCLDCEDKNLIPDEIILYEMGPEHQDITVKVFVSGRPAKKKQRANQFSDKADDISSSCQTSSTPLPPKPPLTRHPRNKSQPLPCQPFPQLTPASTHTPMTHLMKPPVMILIHIPTHSKLQLQ